MEEVIKMAIKQATMIICQNPELDDGLIAMSGVGLLLLLVALW
jgi:hypothetical protein